MERDFDIHKWQAKYLKENTEMPLDEVIDALLDTNDGPITIISPVTRALEMAQNRQASVDTIANALIEALEILESNGGRLDSTEFR